MIMKALLRSDGAGERIDAVSIASLTKAAIRCSPTTSTLTYYLDG
jgi:hypothetical protein